VQAIAAGLLVGCGVALYSRPVPSQAARIIPEGYGAAARVIPQGYTAVSTIVDDAS